MSDRSIDLNPDDLTPPYDYLYDEIDLYTKNHFTAEQHLNRLSMGNEKLADTIETILNLTPGDRPDHQSLADIAPYLETVTWLWPSWIPKGLLTVMAADGGVGKTNVALHLAKCAIHRQPAPDGAALATKSGNVIFVDGENFIRAINERVEVWGMNAGKLYIIRRPKREMIDLTESRYQDELIDACYDLRPDMVIVDSLSTISINGENNVEDLREVLNFLNDVAEAYDCAVVLIHHLRKQSQANIGRPVTMHDLRGSGHLSVIARSIIGLYINTHDPNGPRRMTILKTNLCKYPPPLSFRYVDSYNPKVPKLEFFAVSEPELTDDTLTAQCAEWLIDLLNEHEELSYAEIVEMGEPAGYLQNTIQSARQLLDWRVIDTKGAKRKGNKWTLSPVEYEGGDEITIEQRQPVSHGHMTHVTPPPFRWNPPPAITWPCDGVFVGENGNQTELSQKVSLSNGKINQNGTNGSHGGEQIVDRGPRLPWLPGRRRPYRGRPATIDGPGFNAGYRLRQKRYRPAQARSARGRYRWPPRPAQCTPLGPAPAAPHRGPGAAHQTQKQVRRNGDN